MADKFQVGDHVKWNSEAGHVSGKITKFIDQILITRAIHIMPVKMTLNMKLKATSLIT